MVATWTWWEERKYLWTKGVSCWLVVFCGSLIFSACGKTVAPVPQKTIRDIQIQSQERIFHAAKEEFHATRYAQAIQQINRFLSRYPRSAFQPEAIWLLAQSYQKSGDTENALTQYQRVLALAKAKAYHSEARQHVAHLQSLSTLPSRREEVFAVQMTLEQWRQGHDWNARLKNMARRGVTAQLINLECGITKKEAAFIFKTPPKAGLIDFSSFVQRSHKQGLTVFIGVNARCLGWLNTGANVQWADRAYDQGTQTVRSTKFFDVFNPEYQDFLKKTLVQLASFGVDGIVFLGDAPMGMFDGVTPIALAKFQKEFGQAFYPEKVFTDGSVVDVPQHSTSDGKARKVLVPKESEFWRWVGWRARTRLAVLQDLMGTVRSSYPQVQVALEVYAGGLTDPLRTLVKFTEDILESSQGDFSFLMVDVEGPKPLGLSRSRLHGRGSQKSLPALAKRFLEITKDPTKIWLTVPRKMEAKSWSSESLHEMTRDADIPQGIGLVYDLRPYS